MGWWLSGDGWCVVAALAAGWMIDVDHLVDVGYYVYRSGNSFNLTLIQSGKYFESNAKALVPLHAWELTIALGVLALLYSDARLIIISAALAHGAHLLQDQLKYRVRPLKYSLLSRYQKQFADE